MRYFIREIFPLLLTIAGIVAILALWNPNGMPVEQHAAKQGVK